MKLTKKLIAGALAAALVAVLGLAACSGGNGGGKKDIESIADLYAQGYSCGMTTWDEGHWAAVFQKGEDVTDCYRAIATISADQYLAIEALDIFSETYVQDEQALYETFTGAKVESLAGLVPTQADMDKWVGKTYGDLMAAGYESGDYYFYDGKANFAMSNGTIELEVTAAGTLTDEDFQAISDDAAKLAPIKIGAVSFYGFDWGVLE